VGFCLCVRFVFCRTDTQHTVPFPVPEKESMGLWSWKSQQRINLSSCDETERKPKSRRRFRQGSKISGFKSFRMTQLLCCFHFYVYPWLPWSLKKSLEQLKGDPSRCILITMIGIQLCVEYFPENGIFSREWEWDPLSQVRQTVGIQSQQQQGNYSGRFFQDFLSEGYRDQS